MLAVVGASIAAFSNQSMFTQVNRGLDRFYQNMSDPRKNALFMALWLLGLGAAHTVAQNLPPNNPVPWPTALASASPAATTPADGPSPQPEATPSAAPVSPAATATDLPAPPQPVVLCASDASTSPLDGHNSTAIPAAAYISLSRYSPTLTLHSLVKQLYPYTEAPLGSASCADSSQIVSTVRMREHGNSGQLVFNNPERSSPGGEVWVLMTASGTAGIRSKQEIGSIQALWGDNSEAAPRPLILGHNIADWTFRGQPVPGSKEERQTVVDFDGSQSDVIRVWVDQAFDQTENQFGRAAQLLAVHAATIPEDTTLQSLKIRDRVLGPGLDILAVVVTPGDGSWRAPKLPARSMPICLAASGASKNWSKRGFNVDVAPERTYNIRLGCAGSQEHSPAMATETTLPDLAPGVKFYFNTILATEPSTEGRAANRDSQVVLNITNTISATHVYLLMSARNLCAVKAEAIGQIVIDSHAPTDLIAGQNIRQGRTNVSRARCKSGPSSLTILPPQQQSSDVVAIQGVPLRAQPNDRTDDKPAELWFDLIRVRIPPDQQQITLTIRNNPNYPMGDQAPFFTIYGASLVQAQS